VAGFAALVPAHLPGLHFLQFMPLMCFSWFIFLKIYISQGSVATRFGCGQIFNIVLSQIFRRVCHQVVFFSKSVNICRKYGQQFSGTYLWFTVYELLNLIIIIIII